MARVDGFFSNFRGSIGDITFYVVNGVTYARKKSGPIKRQKTDLVKLNNKKFGMTSRFLSPISEPIALGYKDFKKGKRTARNVAMKYIRNNAISGGGRDPLKIEPHLVKVSRGSLVGVENPQVEWTDEQHVKFTWENNSGQFRAFRSDRIMVVLYDFDRRYAEFDLKNGYRSLQEQVLEVHSPEKSRGKMHAYISVYRKNDRQDCLEVSDSQYVGVI